MPRLRPYYVTLLLNVDTEGWDSSCDETFGVLSYLPPDYQKDAVKIEEASLILDPILTEEGGL